MPGLARILGLREASSQKRRVAAAEVSPSHLGLPQQLSVQCRSLPSASFIKEDASQNYRSKRVLRLASGPVCGLWPQAEATLRDAHEEALGCEAGGGLHTVHIQKKLAKSVHGRVHGVLLWFYGRVSISAACLMLTAVSGPSCLTEPFPKKAEIMCHEVISRRTVMC